MCTYSSKNTPDIHHIITFSCIFFFVQVMGTATTSFYIPRLTSLGFTDSMLGYVTALRFGSGIIAGLLVGLLIDKFGKIKLIFLGLVIINIICIFYIYVFNTVISIVFLSQILTGFCMNALISLDDTWVLGCKNAIAKNYGIIRASHSFGWVCSGLLFALLIKYFGLLSLSIVSVIVMFLLLILLFDAPKIENLHTTISRKEIKELFNNKSYIFFLFAYFFVFVIVNSDMLIIGLKLRGIAENYQFGFFFMCVGLAEIPMMIASGYIMKKIPAIYFLFIGICGYFLRIFLYSRAESIYHMFIIALVTGAISFPFLHISSRMLIRKVVGEKLYGLGMMFGFGVTWGSGGIVGSFLTGIFTDYFGLVLSFKYLLFYVVITFFIILIFYNLLNISCVKPNKTR